MSERKSTYLLRLMGPEDADRARVPGGLLEETEENISSVLPEGWYVKIDEVDAEGEEVSDD